MNAGVAHAAWPTLEESVARARANALPVAEARGAVGTAASTMVGARLSPLNNPYLEVQADTGKYTKDVSITSFMFFPVEMHGQRGARIDEADRLVKFRQQSLTDAQARVTGDVTAAYGDVLVSAARIADAQRAEQAARAEVDYYTQRLQVGDATVFEKSLAEAELSRWAQTRAEAGIRFIEARSLLTQLTALPDVDAPPADAVPGAPPLRGAWGGPSLAQLVESSPLLRALSAEATYWDASKERFSTEKNPPVNLIVNAGRGDMAEFRAGGGLSWSFPITRRNQGEIARAEAEKVRVLNFREIAKNVVLSRAKAAYDMYVATAAGIEEQDKNGIPAAERVVDASFAAYKAGKGELLRVFIARRDLAIARSRRLDLIQVAWRAYGSLAALKGDLP